MADVVKIVSRDAFMQEFVNLLQMLLCQNIAYSLSLCVSHNPCGIINWENIPVISANYWRRQLIFPDP